MNLFLKKLLKNDATGGGVLIIAAAVAMFLANNASMQQSYQTILAMPVQFRLQWRCFSPITPACSSLTRPF
ncbi:hypothetical protein EWM60_00860 [Candidatus Erwinia dacicola]|nr:hypothetical protein [Candidatus Erwinia dacicola]